MTNKGASASIIPKIFTSIAYDDFEETSTKILINDPLNLKIDTAYSNTIMAYEIYEGSTHRKWFFWKNQWREKTTYRINYYSEIDGVSFTIKVISSEAPNDKYYKWQKVYYPSKKTKENIIIEKLD